MHYLKAAIVALSVSVGACTVVQPAPEPLTSPEATAAAKAALDKSTFLYATKGTHKLQLDRISSSAAHFQGKRPVLIYSFGGGWEGGERNDPILAGFFNHFASLGYVVVTIDYRLAIKEAKLSGEMTPANGRDMYLRAIQWGVEDLYDATAFVLNHADEWNIDPDQIIISGSSAGATDSLVAEFNLANQTELARAHLPEGFRYAGVIAMAGAFWLEGDQTPLAWKRKPAPIMFIHGSKDQLVTYDEVHAGFSGYGPVYFQRQFADKGYSSWFIDAPEADHIMALAGLIDYRSEIEAFLTKMVREKQEASIHMIESGKIKKTFANAQQLYGRYLLQLQSGAATP